MHLKRMFGALSLGITTLAGATLLAAVPTLAQGPYPDARRIVSIGGTVTEILYALGAGDRIVAIDTTSTYPQAVTSKPNVGYMRQLSAEGILAQKPDLILAESGAGPVEAMAILDASGTPVVSIPAPPSPDGIAPKIEAVGAAVGKPQEAAALAHSVTDRLAALKADIDGIAEPKKRVLFVLSFANGRVMAAGSATAADAMIALAGGVNAAGDAHGYKPMSDEALIAAAPDVVLVMDHAAMHVTAEQAFAVPALKSSPAGQTGAFIAMEGLYLLGLGPRTADAARDLAAKLYPETIKP
ncbi:ABC transporter substrate-binding protein [Rhizobium sp. CG5]|uniref:heme/hemin ABC transporter substrate-binding protein n=1 Tax=Rhizobium sp. CG5 TaxID=2726076 RepID=UPI0020336B59|nr:ABC transporter substrate-binding protein [Rhizobium sp. CG5]